MQAYEWKTYVLVEWYYSYLLNGIILSAERYYFYLLGEGFSLYWQPNVFSGDSSRF